MTVPKTNRRAFLKKSARFYLGLLGTGMLGTAFSVVGERFWYKINKLPLTVKNLPDAFKGWQVVHFSDAHLGFYYDAEHFRRVVEIINQLNPDILLFTGDLVNTGSPWPGEAISLLSELKTPRGGKWAVLGNHDYWSKEQVKASLTSSDFTVLENTHRFLEIAKQRLYIAGVEDVLYGRPNLDVALDGLSYQDCVLLLVHEPDFVVRSQDYPVCAQFSGHSHGGQVRIPFIGHVVTPLGAKEYVDGLYYIGEKQLPLYVNRGIGTSTLPVRFFCRPEITAFTLS